MRVQPGAGITVALTVGYLAVVSALWWAAGVDYGTVGDTTDDVLRGIVLPVGAGAVLLAAAATHLGWWRPALREEDRAGHRWLLLVPVLFLVAVVGTLLSGEPSQLAASHLLALGAGVLLVGFSEEMLCRGLGLVGLRGSLSEPAAWLWSCVVFALIHAINALFGQSVGSTVVQMASAFAAGTALYVTRRLTGALVWCMLLHAAWDFATLSADAAPGDSASAWGALGLVLWVAIGLAFVGVAVLFRRPATSGAPASPPARTRA